MIKANIIPINGIILIRVTLFFFIPDDIFSTKFVVVGTVVVSNCAVVISVITAVDVVGVG
jgi:hypothetical protein